MGFDIMALAREHEVLDLTVLLETFPYSVKQRDIKFPRGKYPIPIHDNSYDSFWIIEL